MKNTLRLATALAIVLAAGPALATNGMRMIGFSPVQNGMGGVGVGATLDGGAVLTNPAGITELGRRLDVSATVFKPTVDYTATGTTTFDNGDPLPPGVGFFLAPGTKMTTDRGASVIPNLGAVIPLGSGFTAGIGAFGVGGMGVDYKANLYGGVTLTSYQMLRLAPAIAYKVNDMFSAGVTFNAMWAQMKFDVASGFGQQPHDTANSFGFGATLGLKFTPVKDLTFGLAYETKSTFHDFMFDIPAHQVSDGAGGAITIPAGTDELEFNQPAVASGGVAWRAVPGLVLAADVQWINWSDVMGKNKPVYENMAPNGFTTTGAQPFNMSWEDQVVYKVGVSYDATPALALRAGYNYGKMPLVAGRAFENIAFPAVAEHHVTLGAGYAVTERLAINVAGMFSPKATIKGSNPSVPPPLGGTGQGIASYETNMSQFSIDVGVAWQF